MDSFTEMARSTSAVRESPNSRAVAARRLASSSTIYMWPRGRSSSLKLVRQNPTALRCGRLGCLLRHLRCLHLRLEGCTGVAAGLARGTLAVVAAGTPIARGALVCPGLPRRTRVSRAAAAAFHVVVACEPQSQAEPFASTHSSRHSSCATAVHCQPPASASSTHLDLGSAVERSAKRMVAGALHARLLGLGLTRQVASSLSWLYSPAGP